MSVSRGLTRSALIVVESRRVSDVSVVIGILACEPRMGRIRWKSGIRQFSWFLFSSKHCIVYVDVLQAVIVLLFSVLCTAVTGEVCENDRAHGKHCPDFKDDEDETYCCTSRVEPGSYYCCNWEKKQQEAGHGNEFSR